MFSAVRRTCNTARRVPMVFGASLILRIGCAFLIRTVREPGRSRARGMLADVFGKSPADPSLKP